MGSFDPDRIRAAVAEVLDRFPEIQLVYLYGSKVTGNLGPMSDLDLAVLCKSGVQEYEQLPCFSSSVARHVAGAFPDCVSLNRAAPELVFVVISIGVPICETSLSAIWRSVPVLY